MHGPHQVAQNSTTTQPFSVLRSGNEPCIRSFGARPGASSPTFSFTSSANAAKPVASERTAASRWRVVSMIDLLEG